MNSLTAVKEGAEGSGVGSQAGADLGPQGRWQDRFTAFLALAGILSLVYLYWSA